MYQIKYDKKTNHTIKDNILHVIYSHGAVCAEKKDNKKRQFKYYNHKINFSVVWKWIIKSSKKQKNNENNEKIRQP